MAAVDQEERYKRICSQIDRYSDRMEQVFNRFIQLSLATIGGFLWLKTQENAEQISYLFRLVRWILPGLALITIAELALNHIGWRAYRMEEARILQRPELKPRFPMSGRSELLRGLAVCVIGLLGFVWLR